MLADERLRRGAGRAVGDVLRLVGEPLGVGREVEEVHHPVEALLRQVGGDDPAVEVEDLPVPEHRHRLLLLLDDREQATVVGRADHDLLVGEELRRLRAGRPPDRLVLDRARAWRAPGRRPRGSRARRRGPPWRRRRRAAPTRGSSWGASRARACPGTSRGRRRRRARLGHRAVPLGDVGAVAEGRREDDLRDEALVDQAVAEVGRRRRAVGAGGEHRVEVDLHRQALVAEALAVRALDVDEVPGDVAGLVLGAELGHGLVRALVPGEGGLGLGGVGLGVGLLLRGLVGAAPGDDGHRVGAVVAGLEVGVLRAGHEGQEREGGCAEEQFQIHSRTP